MKMQKSFTLIELLIVITIIGILAVALVPRIAQGPARARDVQRKADLQQLATAMELYYADYGEYPNDDGGLPDTDCIGSGDWIDSSISGYLDIPTDPGSGSPMGCANQYYYHAMSYSDDGTSYSSYAIYAEMEITSVAADAAGYFCSSSEKTSSLGMNDLPALQAYIGLGPQECPEEYAYYGVIH